MNNDTKAEVKMPGEISLRLFRTEKILKSEDPRIERKDGNPLSAEDIEKLKRELAYESNYFVDERVYTAIPNNRIELERAWVVNRGYEGHKTIFRGMVSHVSIECVAFKHLNFDLDYSFEFTHGFSDDADRSDNVIIYDVKPFLCKGVQPGQNVSFEGLPYLYKPAKYNGLDMSIKNISNVRFHKKKEETSNLDITRKALEDFYCNELCMFSDHCYRNGICLAAEGALERFLDTIMYNEEDNIVNPYSVADNIKFYRKLNKIKQSELADKMFVTQQEVSKWELGKSLPDTTQCAEMARIFMVPVSNIILSSSIRHEINIDYTDIWDENIAYLKDKRSISDFDNYCYDEAVRKKHCTGLWGGTTVRCLKLSDAEYDALLQFKTMNPNGTELDFWKSYFPSDFEATTSLQSIIENAKQTYRYTHS